MTYAASGQAGNPQVTGIQAEINFSIWFHLNDLTVAGIPAVQLGESKVHNRLLLSTEVVNLAIQNIFFPSRNVNRIVNFLL